MTQVHNMEPTAPAASVHKDPKLVRNSILAGSVAGIVSTFAFYPFDVLRTKMQSAAAMEPGTSQPFKSWRTALSTAIPAHRGPVQVLFHTIQHGGIRALYTGLTLPLTAQAVYKATVFSVNEVTSSALQEWKTQQARKNGVMTTVSLTGRDHFLCGFLGGAVNAFLFVTPVEFVRNQMIADHSRQASGKAARFTGSGDVIRSTVTSKGVLGLWRGVSLAVTRDALGCGCFFYTFHFLKQRLPQDEASSTVLAGAASGLAFWVAALPLDTAKTWVQNGSAVSGRIAVKESLSQHGVVGTAKRLTRGWQVALGRGAPAAAVTITTYAGVQQFLSTTNL